MIISASRRTDIAAFCAEWVIRRLRAGYCAVANPYNRNQVTWISLKPEDVDAVVFWTRTPRPLMAHLDELDAEGYCYCFQFTIVGHRSAHRELGVDAQALFELGAWRYSIRFSGKGKWQPSTENPLGARHEGML
jgi:hypothetical protein